MNASKLLLLLKTQQLHSVFYASCPIKVVQWKPLNVITLGQTETVSINQMITIGDLKTYKRVIRAGKTV